jgi:hypothetical protein
MATEFDGLRLEFFSTMIRNPENLRIGLWAAWAGGAGAGFALASMAAFYSEPRPTLDCVFGALGLPVDAAQTEEIADAIVDSYAGIAAAHLPMANNASSSSSTYERSRLASDLL